MFVSHSNKQIQMYLHGAVWEVRKLVTLVFGWVLCIYLSFIICKQTFLMQTHSNQRNLRFWRESQNMLIYEPLFYNFSSSSQTSWILHFLILHILKEKTIFHIFSSTDFTSKSEGDILLVRSLFKNRCSVLQEILLHNSNFKHLKKHQFVTEMTVIRLQINTGITTLLLNTLVVIKDHFATAYN